MPLQATSGAASYDGFGGGVAAKPNYIEDVFNTYVYTGTGANQTITTGIDLQTKGGLLWVKKRSAADNHFLESTNTGGAGYVLDSSSTNALSGFNANNISSIGTTGFGTGINASNSGATYVSWSFRKQPKFFDVVTFTAPATGATNFYVNHSLGSVPGCVIIKRTDSIESWIVCHRGITNSAQNFLELNSSNATWTSGVDAYIPTSTNVMLRTGVTVSGGGQYVMYVFAHNAGGFGLTGTDNVITCDTFTTDGSGNATISLGFEPQWVMYKCTSRSGDNWIVADDMRSFTTSRSSTRPLFPNTASAESTATFIQKNTPTSDGFQASQEGTNQTFIYIAIRRGPMKVPTSGTSVYNGIARTGTGTNNLVVNTTVLPNSLLTAFRIGSSKALFDRLRGFSQALETSSTVAENNNPGYGPQALGNTSYTQGSSDGFSYNLSGYTFIDWVFSRAPGFFDEVCYTGTGSARTINHNLGVAPELMIVKSRSDGTRSWYVYAAPQGQQFGRLDQTVQFFADANIWNSTTPTASVFSVGASTASNANGATMVAYLFATCPGVSKVGSYTGTGATQTIACGFTGGARFVLIKRTDSTGDWYVWDTARGMVAGTDPNLQLNTTNGETNTNDVYTTTGGFQIVSTAAGINASGGTYIFLAIA